MKKYTIWAFAAAISFAAVLSCAKEESINNFEDPENNLAGEQVTINASISPALTKVVFDPTYTADKPSSLSLTWKSSDKLRVADHANSSSYVDFDLTSGAGGQSAVFTGMAPVGATSYDVSIVNGDVAAGQAADGTTTHLQYLASKEDITDLTSVAFDTFNSILAITAKMPSDVAAVIKSVDITAYQSDGTTPANIFNAGNTLSITFGTIGDEGADNVLHFFATLPQGDQEVAAGTKLLVHFNAPGTAHTVYTRFIELGATTFTNSKLNTININATQSATHAGLTSCDGTTSAKAYLIGDIYQMNAVASLLTATKNYVKLVDNIDMTNFSASMSTTADTKVDFNGNNKTISNLSKPLFVALFGGVHDLIIDGATVSISGNDKGILAQTAGSSVVADDMVAENITITSSSISNNNQRTGALIGRLWGKVKHVSTDADCSVSGAAQTGGLVGRLDAGTIDDCSTAGTVTCSSYYQGGLVGMVEGGTIKNSSSSATVTNNLNGTYSRCGGLVGLIEDGTVIISYCHTTGKVSATVSGKGSEVGGLIGQVTPATGKTISLTLEKSYATGEVSNNGYNRVGGLIGEISGGASANITDCYYSGTISSSNYSGGIIGFIDGDATSVTITRGFTNATITSSGGSVGVLCHAGAGTVTCSNFVGWNTSGKSFGTGSSAPAATGNYYGTSGTIYSQAAALTGWNFTNVWTTDDIPQLMPYTPAP